MAALCDVGCSCGRSGHSNACGWGHFSSVGSGRLADKSKRNKRKYSSAYYALVTDSQRCLLTMATIETIFFIDVITAAIAVLILLVFLKIPVHTKALNKQTTSYLTDMKLGFSYIKNHAFLKNSFCFSLYSLS